MPASSPAAGLQQLDLEAAALGPAHHHPQDHLGPVLGVGAARAGVDGHERVAGVVLARRTGAPPRARRGASRPRRTPPRAPRRARRPPRRARRGPRGRRRRPAACVNASSLRCVRACSALDLGGGCRGRPRSRAPPSRPRARSGARCSEAGSKVVREQGHLLADGGQPLRGGLGGGGGAAMVLRLAARQARPRTRARAGSRPRRAAARRRCGSARRAPARPRSR